MFTEHVDSQRTVEMNARHFGAKFVAIAPVYYSNLAGVVLGREGLADRNLCFRTQLTELKNWVSDVDAGRHTSLCFFQCWASQRRSHEVFWSILSAWNGFFTLQFCVDLPVWDNNTPEFWGGLGFPRETLHLDPDIAGSRLALLVAVILLFASSTTGFGSPVHVKSSIAWGIAKLPTFRLLPQAAQIGGSWHTGAQEPLLSDGMVRYHNITSHIYNYVMLCTFKLHIRIIS